MVFVMQLISQDRAVSVDFLTGLNNRKELMRYLGRLFEKTDELDQNLGLILLILTILKVSMTPMAIIRAIRLY